jgi:hypothetical protein
MSPKLPSGDAEVMEALASIWDLLLEGNEDKEIMELMGLEAPQYKYLRQRLLETKAEELKAKPPEHMYVDYIVWQSRGIVDLTKMIKQFSTTKQYNAMVGAIRVRADLYDKIMTKGQEFGVFKKAPERKEIVGGFILADLTNVELRKMIFKSLGEMDKMMKRYGEMDIIDIDPGETHSGPRLVAEAGTHEDIEVPEAPPAKDDAPVAAPAPIGSKAIAPSILTRAPVPAKTIKPATSSAKGKTSRHSSKARGRRPFAEAGKPKVVHEPGSDVWGD